MSIFAVIALLFLLILLRVPVVFAILIPSVLYVALDPSLTFSIVLQQMAGTLNSFTLLAVPLFIMVGYIANESGMATRLLDAVSAVIGRVRNSLAYVNASSSMAFSTMSGTATADAAAMGSIMIPQMKRRGYSPGYASGLTAASSLIGPIMPPSVVAILYAVLSGSSVASMFLAGVIPALILFLALCIYIFIHSLKNREEEQPRMPGKERVMAIVKAIPIMMTPVIIFVGILGGIFTITESAAIAVFYFVCLGLGTRWMSFKQLGSALTKSVATAGRIMIIATAGGLLAYVMAREGVSNSIAELLGTISDNPVLVLLLINVFLLLVGTVLEPVSALLIVVPTLAPVVAQFGIDPLHFGVIVILNLSIGLLTPPVGIVLFVLSEVGHTSLGEIFKGIVPFLAMLIAVLLLFTFVPQLVMFLPNLIGVG
ncbi:TRAP transporter large permease [Yaniella halotolerans]|uniref:TRAP transporter large permease n=1 Tax=Yaniella halotolerans TaxID=225453 RepID=UPI0003B2E3AD|nr:TRAP transporter large permease [Yaniella halotolerans]